MFLFRKSILKELEEQQRQYIQEKGEYPTDVVLSKRELQELIKECRLTFFQSLSQPQCKTGFMIRGLVVHLEHKGNAEFSYEDVFN